MDIYDNCFNKNLKKKGVEQMRNNLLVMVACVIFVAVVVSLCYADYKTVDVKAYIPQQNGLTVTVSKIVGATWTDATSMDFGNLTFDTVNKIFTAACYFSVDVGINSNQAAWTITHTRTSLINGTDNLDKNVNVTFMKQTSATAGTQLDKLSYADSNNKAYTKTALSGGWLRVYYGIATGDGKDAPNTEVIGATQTYGNYAGQVTLTLTP